MPVRALQISDIAVPPRGLGGTLRIPPRAKAAVVFAHGSGSSRFSVRNIAVAERLGEHGIATLLFDLLTPVEEADRSNVFDIPLLTGRLVEAVDQVSRDRTLGALPLGLFGASTGAAAALAAAAALPGRVRAVVSRGGRPDLAADALEDVHAPTLLIVGGADVEVLALNRQAFQRLKAPKALEVVAGATHLFQEPGALEAVADLAADWFGRHLAPAGVAASDRTEAVR